MKRVAAIDLGTNSALLLVAQRGASGRFEEVEDHCETPRLGAGLGAHGGSGVLDPRAVERTLGVLEVFRSHCERLRVDPRDRVAVSTAVLRRVDEPAPFLGSARACLGHPVDVLSPEREAELGWRAVLGEDGVEPLALVDVGGGSTEVLSSGGRRIQSVPWGAVGLTEAFLRSDSATGARSEGSPNSSRACGGVQALEAELARAFGVFPRLEPGVLSGSSEGSAVVALGGTGANLVCLERGGATFDHRIAEGATVRRESALEWGRRLAEMTDQERAGLPIEPSRSDILAAGCLALGHGLSRLGAESARVSGRGLRFGLARELLGFD